MPKVNNDSISMGKSCANRVSVILRVKVLMDKYKYAEDGFFYTRTPMPTSKAAKQPMYVYVYFCI